MELIILSLIYLGSVLFVGWGPKLLSHSQNFQNSTKILFNPQAPLKFYNSFS